VPSPARTVPSRKIRRVTTSGTRSATEVSSKRLTSSTNSIIRRSTAIVAN
jgi:hypothetical protein